MKHFLFLFLFSFPLFAASQMNFAFTSAANRIEHDKKLRDSIIMYRLEHFSDPVDETQLKGAFWGMELMLFKEKFGEEKLKQIWLNASYYSESFQKALLEVSYTLFPLTFEKQIAQLLHSTTSPAIFARAVEYVRRISKKYDTLIKDRIAGFDTSTPLLQTLLRRIDTKKTFLSKQQLQTLFSKNFLPGQTVIYSIQRANRDYPGLVIIRSAEGNFIRENGKFFSVSQLARSITNYPFYITNGNTPQGIFKWTGFDSSSNNYIGPTTNLQMVMPFEAEANVFFPNENNVWNKSMYASLLSRSLQQSENLYESFYAGQIGRSEIIMHGTTINPSYYINMSYFPNTPSMGCLCSYEEWSADGTLKKSNQFSIINILRQYNAVNGFVVVLEIDNKNKPVELSDIASFIK